MCTSSGCVQVLAHWTTAIYWHFPISATRATIAFTAPPSCQTKDSLSQTYCSVPARGCPVSSQRAPPLKECSITPLDCEPVCTRKESAVVGATRPISITWNLSPFAACHWRTLSRWQTSYVHHPSVVAVQSPDRESMTVATAGSLSGT